MILPSQIHREIVEYIKKLKNLNSQCFDDLFKAFPKIDKNILACILHFHIQKRTILNIRWVKRDILDIVETYHKMIEEGKTGVFINLAEKYGVTPMSVARQVLEFFEVKNREDPKTKSLVAFKDLIKDSTLITNSTLAYEIHIASLADSSYSQIANLISAIKGKEFELYLQSCLLSQGLSFKTEDQLRDLNFTKTPDILLDVPFAIDNFIVKWIECKACFADNVLHEEYLEQQYQHYFRFGPGLVIYWFGYLETVQNIRKKLLIYDHFPTKIIKMN